MYCVVLHLDEEYKTFESCDPRSIDVKSAKMADYSCISDSPSYKQNLNKGRKRRTNIDEWKNVKRKTLKQHGREYITRKGVIKVVKKKHPNAVSGIRM